jgi:hypothetical protein
MKKIMIFLLTITLINNNLSAQKDDFAFKILKKAFFRSVDTFIYSGWDVMDESGFRKITISHINNRVYFTRSNGSLDTVNIRYVDTCFINKGNGMSTLIIETFKPKTSNKISKAKIIKLEKSSNSIVYEMLFLGKELEIKYTLTPD